MSEQMQLDQPPLEWSIEHRPEMVLIHFTITRSDGVLDPAWLTRLDLPEETRGSEPGGLVLSGRGPIWLYGHLLHRAHVFAWCAVYDPRLQGAVVVMRHTPDSPALGQIVPVSPGSLES